MKEVLRVPREGVGNLCETAREARHRGRRAREVRVQMLDRRAAHGARQHCGVMDGQRVLSPGRLELAPEAGQGGRGVLQRGPQVGRRLRALGVQVVYGRPHSGNPLLEVGVVGRAQGEDLHFEPGRLVGGDFRHDEGLRVAWVALHHVPDAARRVRRHAGPQLWLGARVRHAACTA